jgi:hypothetical protein
MKNIILFLLASTTVLGGLKQSSEELKYPPISINQENFVSDKNGVFNPALLLNLKPGNIISFSLEDGTQISGLVKSIEIDNNKIFKLFGDALNQKNCGFGFVVTADEIFAGALIFRDESKTYTVKFKESFKGFVLEHQVEKLKIQ